MLKALKNQVLSVTLNKERWDFTNCIKCCKYRDFIASLSQGANTNSMGFSIMK
jgi:hypothetical protein